MKIFKKYILIIALLGMTLVSSACNEQRIENTAENVNKLKPGVALTFDDKSIMEWYENRELFNEYGAKATFFVSNIHEISDEELDMLKTLKEEGHEIGSHGFNHLNAQKFVELYSLEDYINIEIVPSIKIMQDNGLTPTSFAYPFGSKNSEIGAALLEEFNIVRGTSYTNKEKRIKDLDSAYYSLKKNNESISAVGIDNIYNNTSKEILEGLERAKDNNEILVLYGHIIGESEESDAYITSKEKLEEIFKYMKNENLKFYNVSEITNH